MSEELVTQFKQAGEDVKKLSEAPDNVTMLRLYGLYKQGSQGDCQAERPGLIDFVARAKYDAWKALAGATQEAAMRQYIELVRSLQEADRK